QLKRHNRLRLTHRPVRKFDDQVKPLCERHCTRPGIGRDVLGTQVAPLMEHPDLLETLRIHIDNDLNRQRTARQLHVHPNTVDYRLRRIAQLTGLDPADARGLWYLRSALIVWTDGGTRRLPADARRMADSR
ncbi:PucR family transcriptional regulator, partial [Nocardia sp. NPDC004260]